MKKKGTKAAPKRGVVLQSVVREQSEIKRFVGKRNGVCIRIRGWTEETGSGSETHAKSITAAIRELRRVAKYHPNFSVDVYCEGPRQDEPFCCEWFHHRHMAFISNPQGSCAAAERT